MATYRAESLILNKKIAKQLAAFERRVWRRMFWGIKVNENSRKWYNKEMMPLFTDLNILSFFRICQLNWIGHVSRVDNKRKVSSVV